MWDIIVLNKMDDFYLVMTPNGETHTITQETYDIFKQQNRIADENSSTC
jgi:16S rRNA C1402 (ribose-2'-O) methylase RsmI